MRTFQEYNITIVIVQLLFIFKRFEKFMIASITTLKEKIIMLTLLKEEVDCRSRTKQVMC